MSAEGQLSSAAPWPERWKGRAKPSISRLRQKNQVGLNSDTGAKGAKRRKTEASAAKPPTLNVRRSQSRRWKQWLGIENLSESKRQCWG